jgi:hypothetical protein
LAGCASIRRRTACIACRANPGDSCTGAFMRLCGEASGGGELFTLVAKSAHLRGLPDVRDRLDPARRQDVRLSDRR